MDLCASESSRGMSLLCCSIIHDNGCSLRDSKEKRCVSTLSPTGRCGDPPKSTLPHPRLGFPLNLSLDFA